MAKTHRRTPVERIADRIRRQFAGDPVEWAIAAARFWVKLGAHDLPEIR